MNRVRKYDGIYQVLLTPNNNMSPDSSLLTGNWLDPTFKDFGVLNFDNMNDAVYESLKYPDINWSKIILDHTEIFKQLYRKIFGLIARRNISVQFIPKLMTPEELKNEMFNRVMNNNDFNLFDNFTDIISFTIVYPWTRKLSDISGMLQREIYDGYKIQHKKTYYGKIIELIGYTPYGTPYQIRLLPNVLHQYILGMPITRIKYNDNFANLLKTQDNLDKNTMVI